MVIVTCNQSMGTTQQAIMGLPRHLTPKLNKQGEYKWHYLNHNARTRKRDGTVAPTARPHPWVVNFYRIFTVSRFHCEILFHSTLKLKSYSVSKILQAWYRRGKKENARGKLQNWLFALMLYIINFENHVENLDNKSSSSCT